jgi:hypothetical protein
VDRIDYDATYMNAFTSGVFRSVRIPITLEDDRAALEAALNRAPDPAAVRMARIVNTGAMETFWTSESVLPELRKREGIFVDETPLELTFSDEGRLLSLQ